ncbi:hypothetical protein RKD20_006992 [Streptomyces sp. SLBN-8D4]
MGRGSDLGWAPGVPVQGLERVWAGSGPRQSDSVRCSVLGARCSVVRGELSAPCGSLGAVPPRGRGEHGRAGTHVPLPTVPAPLACARAERHRLVPPGVRFRPCGLGARSEQLPLAPSCVRFRSPCLARARNSCLRAPLPAVPDPSQGFAPTSPCSRPRTLCSGPPPAFAATSSCSRPRTLCSGLPRGARSDQLPLTSPYATSRPAAGARGEQLPARAPRARVRPAAGAR